MIVLYTQEKEHIGNNIRRYLEKEHMTQKELAYRVGVHLNHVNKWVLGKHAPSEEHLKKIAKIFGVSIKDLIKPVKEEYYDADGKGFATLAQLCRAHRLEYNKMYHLIHKKGMSSSDAHKCLLNENKYNLSGFILQSKYPSREYKRYLWHMINKCYVSGEVLNRSEYEDKVLEFAGNDYFFDAFDCWCLGEMQPYCARLTGYAYNMIKHPRGIYKDILEFGYITGLLNPQTVEYASERLYKIVTTPPDHEADFIKEEKTRLNCPYAKRPGSPCQLKDIKHKPTITAKHWQKATVNDITPEQEDLLKNVIKEIKTAEEHLETLKRQKYDLQRQIECDNVGNLPFTPSHKNAGAFCGMYHESPKEGNHYLYWNDEDKTYYRKPLYRKNGNLLGSMKYVPEIESKLKSLIFFKYTDVTKG